MSSQEEGTSGTAELYRKDPSTCTRLTGTTGKFQICWHIYYFIHFHIGLSTVLSELLLPLLHYKVAIGCRVLYGQYLMQEHCWEKENMKILTKYFK